MGQNSLMCAAHAFADLSFKGYQHQRGGCSLLKPATALKVERHSPICRMTLPAHASTGALVDFLQCWCPHLNVTPQK